MPNVDIKGVGIVAFPDSMDEGSVAHYASGLYSKAHGMGEGTPNFTGEPMFKNLLAEDERPGITGLGPHGQIRPAAATSPAASDRPAETDSTSLGVAAANQPPVHHEPTDFRDEASWSPPT